MADSEPLPEDVPSPEELKEQAREEKQEREQRQAEVLNAIADEHDVPTIETEADLDLDMDLDTALSLRTDGETIDSLERMADLDGKAQMRANAEQVATILGDVYDGETLGDREFWTTVYDRFGPVVLFQYAADTMAAIEEEMQQLEGAIDGFRQQ